MITIMTKTTYMFRYYFIFQLIPKTLIHLYWKVLYNVSHSIGQILSQEWLDTLKGLQVYLRRIPVYIYILNFKKWYLQFQILAHNINENHLSPYFTFFAHSSYNKNIIHIYYKICIFDNCSKEAWRRMLWLLKKMQRRWWSCSLRLEKEKEEHSSRSLGLKSLVQFIWTSFTIT